MVFAMRGLRMLIAAGLGISVLLMVNAMVHVHTPSESPTLRALPLGDAAHRVRRQCLARR